MKQNKIYLGLIGGLGDVIYQYIYDPAWQSLEDYKTKNPDVQVKAIVVSHNPLAHEIVQLNPDIDIVEWHPPKREMRDLKWKHSEVIHQYAKGYMPFIDTADSIKKRPYIYLTRSETQLVYNLTMGKTAILHPFASEEIRIAIPPYQYRPVVDKLIYKGFNVVTLGGSYIKSFGKDEQYEIVEKFSYPESNNYTSLIGKVNTRTSIALVIAADLFVGTWSCYGVTAWMHGVRAIVSVSKEQWEGCNKIHRGKYKNHHKCDKLFDIGGRRTNIKSLVRSI